MLRIAYAGYAYFASRIYKGLCKRTASTQVCWT